jgi:hypothetical protein
MSGTNVGFVSGITASTFTGAVVGPRIRGKFSLNLIFSSTGTVVLQRRGQTSANTIRDAANPADQNWVDVETYTASIADEGESGGDFEYRLNITANAGTIEYWLGR